MAKTQEELNELKQECEALTNKLKELTEDELKQVAAGYPGIEPGGLYTVISQLSLPVD